MSNIFEVISQQLVDKFVQFVRFDGNDGRRKRGELLLERRILGKARFDLEARPKQKGDLGEEVKEVEVARSALVGFALKILNIHFFLIL